MAKRVDNAKQWLSLLRFISSADKEWFDATPDKLFAAHYHLKTAGLGHKVEVVGAQAEGEGFALAFFGSTFWEP